MKMFDSVKMIALGTMVCVAFAGFASAEEKTVTCRVGTYNVRLQFGDAGTPNAWNNRKEDLVDLIKKMDVDVCGLQEVCPGQSDYITNSLPQYVMIGRHRDDGVRKGEASPVLYRKDRFDLVDSGTFWLSETPDVPGSRSWGTACTRVCTWTVLKDRKSGKKFCFANTHTDHVSKLARKEGMLLIVRKMNEFAPKGAPLVFTGDHNCLESSEPAMAVAKKLKSAIHICETPVEGPWRTLVLWKKYGSDELRAADALKMSFEERAAIDKSHPRIDYIYVSAGVKVKSCRTYDDVRKDGIAHPSDHLPVAASLQF